MTVVKFNPDSYGYTGVRKRLVSEQNRSIRKKLDQGIKATMTSEIDLRVFDEMVKPSKSNSFTKTQGKIYGAQVKFIYSINRHHSIREGWQYVSAKLTKDICGEGSVYNIENESNKTEYGTWALRDKSAEHVYESKVREQLAIILGIANIGNLVNTVIRPNSV
jgi:hypothetical protein